MNRFCTLILLTSSLFAGDISVLEKDEHSITVRFTIPEPQLSSFEIGDRSVQLPRWSNAYEAYDSSNQTLAPFFTLPLILPPNGDIPEIQILASEFLRDGRLSKVKFQPQDLGPANRLPSIEAVEMINLKGAEDFRDYKTARIMVYPYFIAGQRLSSLTFRLDFPAYSGSELSQESDLIQGYLNADMAKNWAKTPASSLGRTASVWPQGQWFRFPINAMGIHRINVASFGDNLPETNPISWQVYAPYYEGQALPFSLSHTEPTPDNFKAISMQGSGLEDGVFSDDDEIIFFAQALNGDFKGDNFTHLFGKQRYYWICIPFDDSETANQIDFLPSYLGTHTETVRSYQKRLYHETDLHNQLHSGQSWVGEKLTGSSDQFYISFSDDYLDLSSEINLNVLFRIDYDVDNYQDILDVELNDIPFNVNQIKTVQNKKIILNGTAGENLMRDKSVGNNILKLDYSSNSPNSIIYLDSLRFSYDRQLAPSSEYLFGTVDLPGAINRLIFQDLSSGFQLWDISNPSNVVEWQIENNLYLHQGTGKHEIIGFNDDQLIDVILTETADQGNPQLRQAGRQADYIIITPEIFLDQAERIRELREELVPEAEQLTVEIVKINDIYDEFSAGTVDPAAIKHFLHYVYFSWDQSNRIRYVLFLGDTDYDYRNITGQSKMLIPTFQKDGISDISSYATDDKYTFIASGIWDALPDIAIGRYPAQRVDQLEIMIDKLISYELTPEPGIWRNTVTLVADDPLRPSKTVEYAHITDTESLAGIIPESMHVDKVYLTEYPEVQDPNSPYIKKPKARDEFLQKLFNGTLLVNYLGHGSPNVWAQEEVFTVSDLGLVKTNMRLPFWVAGTCDWAKYDDVSSSCVPEELMLMESNGAIGILSTTRKTFSSYNRILLLDFFDFLFPDNQASRSIPVGDAIMMAKNITAGSDPNNEKYVLFSDPALRLASPVRKGQIQSVTPSVLQAMGSVNFSGLTDTSLVADAMAAVTVYDTPTPVTRSFYNSATGSTGHISYVLPGKRIFRGLISVNGRDFGGEFTIPKDIKYSGEGGILHVQYWDDTGLDGSAFIDTLTFLGTDSTALDDTGPEIVFISENMVLLNGDHFSANEALEIEIWDEQGINLTGAAGHGITLAIDEDWSNAVDVTELFEYDLDHSDRGRLLAFLTEILPGEHLVSVKAWDSQNNPGEASVRLNFFAANDFRIYNLFNFPNPMVNDTEVTYMLSHAADVEYSIYSLAGRKIIGETVGFQIQGFNSFPWDGRDRFGNRLANGVYILVVEGGSDEFNEAAQSLQKLVIAR
ncbi:type IX secretion system sortase PorU [bacterium]|nr:type IX secretion system sortase PorU [bacterium]